MCESDRHQANLVVHEDATFRFIDNDHELNNRMVMGTSLITSKDASCMPNSIFLPHTLETWRVGPHAVLALHELHLATQLLCQSYHGPGDCLRWWAFTICSKACQCDLPCLPSICWAAYWYELTTGNVNNGSLIALSLSQARLPSGMEI